MAASLPSPGNRPLCLYHGPSSVRRAAFGELSQYKDEVLRLRSLAQRRRAVFLPSTTRRYDYPYIRSLEFLVRCPPEIAWTVLGFWRCQYPVETSIIDELGVH